ncbi:MAG: VapC toxin family PIN domain ribonuclease [Thermoprotei archaeon]|nr:MAG: VapC toxin family PIN domain ribonuclease [Thermoprotei archaeon]
MRVNEGERVLTTVVHLGEVANILEDVAGSGLAASFIQDLLLKENVFVEPVTVNDNLEGAMMALQKGVSVNDAVAYLTMRRKGVTEIYTFDKHFEKLSVKIVQE